MMHSTRPAALVPRRRGVRQALWSEATGWRPPRLAQMRWNDASLFWKPYFHCIVPVLQLTWLNLASYMFAFADPSERPSGDSAAEK
jgi:hypothetical protein